MGGLGASKHHKQAPGLFGFKFKQMRDSVRTNDSDTLDLIWRENLASARAATKHGGTNEQGKTNYAAMSVVLVYWGCALVEPLATAYRRTRTIRCIDAHVGWDFPIEYLNKLIKESVVANITHELIAKFIRALNFTYVVHRALNMIVKANREPDAAKLKKVDHEKKLLLEWLRGSIGTTYAQATAASEPPERQHDAMGRQPKRGRETGGDAVGQAAGGDGGLPRLRPPQAA